MAITLTITNSSGISRTVHPTDINFLQEGNEPASMSCTFESNVDIYESETSAANALQLEAAAVLDRHGSQEFEGNIKTKTSSKLPGGKWQIAVTILDKLAQGKGTRASQADTDTWEYSTPTASVTEDDLMPSQQNVRAPYERIVTSLLPTIDSANAAPNFALGDWDNRSDVWLALEKYNSTPISQTVYTANVDSGTYVLASINENAPVAGQTTVTIDITSLTNIPDEFIIGEKVVVARSAGSDTYAGYNLLTNDGGIGVTLTLVLDGINLPTLAGAAVISPLALKLSATSGGLAFGGWLLWDDEIIWFDGLDIDASGIYTARSIARNNRAFNLTLSDAGKHYLINEYDAALAGANVLITGGNQYAIAVSQNSLFPVGSIVELFNLTVSQGDFTVATSSWTAGTDTCTITTVEALPVAIDEIRTQNRVINIIPQKIAPGEMTVEGYNATDGYALVTPKQYDVNYANGEIQTTLLSSLLGASYNSGGTTISEATKWRASFSYYDELNANALTVGNVITAVVEESQVLKGNTVGDSAGNGAWGLATGDSVVTGLDDKITKASGAEPQLTFEFLDDFLNDLGYLSTTETLVNYFWNSQTSKLNVVKLTQGAVAGTYHSVAAITRESVLDEVFTGVLLNYEVPAARSFVQTFFWAPDDNVYDNPGSTCNGVEPDRAGVLVQEEAGGDGWKNLQFSASPEESHRNFPMQYVTDGLESTGYGLEYGTNPGVTAPENQYTFFTWFDEPGYYSGAVCNPVLISKARAVVDVRKKADSGTYTGDFSLDIQVVGITAFTSPKLWDAATEDLAPVFAVADVVDLPGMRIRYQGDQDLTGVSKVELEAEDINLSLAAGCVKYNAASFESGSTDNTFCRLKELVFEESTKRSVFVRLTDDATDGDSRTVYAPLTYAKLVNPNHKVIEVDNGDVIYDGAAISLARAILLQRLVLEDSREYTLKLSASETMPALTSTIRILVGTEDYTGVVLAREYTLERGVETVTVVVRDFTAPILT